MSQGRNSYCLTFEGIYGKKGLDVDVKVAPRGSVKRRCGVRLFLGAVAALATTSVASGIFIVQDPPNEGNSWTQHIVAAGPFDYIAFEILTDSGGGLFKGPWISGFVDHTASWPDPPGPVYTWDAVTLPETTDGYFVAATGEAAESALLGFDLHFDGNLNLGVTFQGVAFNEGEIAFSAEFTWTGIGFMNIGNRNGWQPDPGGMPGMPVTPIPLPAPVWLGSLGLLAVIAIRRKIL